MPLERSLAIIARVRPDISGFGLQERRGFGLF
eukprot:CAMPEP_0183367324 /NCGR_PEP_ID=MMETSP0164_2-20130417/92079_1 /TAXON_ID=221442 /ORGANISM="Coccolithus pelagicus ssp braarudi, Strain PLY182g" /LENGTH=31 /DNA_ID= /DNA_START= /DNA_END= /DNA_ORIENTATION=